MGTASDCRRQCGKKTENATIIVVAFNVKRNEVPKCRLRLLRSQDFVWRSFFCTKKIATQRIAILKWCSERDCTRTHSGACLALRVNCVAIYTSQKLLLCKTFVFEPQGVLVLTSHKKIATQRIAILKWCSERDSNPHGLRHTPLKRTCLPIPPPERFLKPHICRYFPSDGKTFFCFFSKKIKKLTKVFGKLFFINEIMLISFPMFF